MFPSIHGSQVDLIAKFKEMVLNDYDFNLREHNQQEEFDVERFNILEEIAGHMEESRLQQLGSPFTAYSLMPDLSNTFSWVKNLKLAGICIAGLVALLIIAKCVSLIKTLCCCGCCGRTKTIVHVPKNDKSKKKHKPKHPKEAPQNIYPAVEMPLINQNSEEMKSKTAHSHKICTYIEGSGFQWDDGCPCGKD